MRGDWLALPERSGRALVVSLSGRPARAVGRGVPRSFSPDGRWLTIVRELANEIDIVSIEDPARRLSLSGWGGAWSPDAATFVYTGVGAYDVPRPLHAALPAEGRTVLLESRVLDFDALPGGEVLAVIPPGSPRPAGIYRRRIPPAAATGSREKKGEP